MNYSRLTFRDQEEISRGLAQHLSVTAIAHQLAVAPSTVSREIGRARMNTHTYRAGKAQRHARRAQASRSRNKITTNPELETYVQTKLRLKWSPEQIAHSLKKEYNTCMSVSHETIYTYLYCLPRGALKKELLSCLRSDRKRRHRRGNAHEKRGQISDMLSIEERPAEVANRTVPGHWEGDLIIGRSRQSALGTLVERTTRTTILVPLRARDATTVRRAFAWAIKQLPKEMRLSLTYDRGKEMAEHKLFTKDTKVRVYFAHPQSPWERGTNENTNGLIRQFFPKGTDFTKVSRKEIKQVQDLLNGRPRKALEWETPYEVFERTIALES